MKNREFLQTTITRSAEEVENYVGIPLTNDLRQKLQEVADSFVTKSLEETAAFALDVGVNRLLDLDKPARDEDEPSAQEQMSLLARAFEVREQIQTPPSITLSLKTKERYVIDRLRNARPEMTFDDIITMVVAKGIAQVMKENDIERTEPARAELFAKRNVVSLSGRRPTASIRRPRRW